MAVVNSTDINEVIKKLEKTVTVFSKRDRKGLLVKASAVVRKELRMSTKVGSRKHYRYAKGTKITYYPGNLRRSMKRLVSLKRSASVFVGPEFGGRKGVTEYGRTAANTDGYYYGMAYGSVNRYRNELLLPAAKRSEAASIAAFEKDFARRFGTRAAQQGLDVS